MTQTTNNLPIERTPAQRTARRTKIALALGILAAVLSGTALALTIAWLRMHAPAEPAAPGSPRESALSAESAFPAESAKDAFLRSMANCGIEQGYGAAIAYDDSTPQVPAALAVRIPRVMDAAGATTEQFSCIASQLSMPLLLIDRMTDQDGDTGQSAWTTQTSGSMAVHWTRGPGGLIVVISGQGEQDGGL